MNTESYKNLMTAYKTAIYSHGIFSDEAKAADLCLYNDGNIRVREMNDTERELFMQASDEWYMTELNAYWDWLRGRRAEMDRSIQTYNFLGPRHWRG